MCRAVFPFFRLLALLAHQPPDISAYQASENLLLLPSYRTMAQGVTKLKKKKQPSTASATKSIKRSTCSLSPRYLSLLSLTSLRRVDRPAPKKTTSVDKIRKKFSAQTIRSIESFAASKVMANKGKLSVVRADPTVLKKVAKHKEKLARQ